MNTKGSDMRTVLETSDSLHRGHLEQQLCAGFGRAVCGVWSRARRVSDRVVLLSSTGRPHPLQQLRTCTKVWLWILGAYRHEIGRIARAKRGAS